MCTHVLFWITHQDHFFPAGKFQMQVLPQCGHAVHEDSPDKVIFPSLPISSPGLSPQSWGVHVYGW